MNRSSRPDSSHILSLDPRQRQCLEMQVAFGVDAVVAARPATFLSAKPVENQPRDARRDGHRDKVTQALPKFSGEKIAHRQSSRPSASASISTPASSKHTSVPLSRACKEAEELATQANSLEELREKIAQFDGCPLKATAGKLVFGTGVENPVVMLVGEGPGAEEDRRGVPFVGASGRLMQRSLEIIGLNCQTNLYISNTVYWRPPADRTPHDTEIATCLPFLRRQIALVKPRILVLVGARAAQTFLGTSSGITRIRGSWAEPVPGMLSENLPALPIFHPAYLFRNHAQKRVFWHDILRIRQKIDELSLSVPWPDDALQGFSSGWRV